MTEKEKVLEAVRDLPDDCTLDDIADRIEFLAATQKGFDQLDNGEGIPHDDLKNLDDCGFHYDIPSLDQQSEKDALRSVLSALKQQPTESLEPIREILLEESAARKYVTRRYQTLINRQYRDGLSANEADELEELKATLNQMDEPYYEPIIRRLRQLFEQRESSRWHTSPDELPLP